MNGPSNISKDAGSFPQRSPVSTPREPLNPEPSKENTDKSTRRKACDTCQRRKIKCDLSTKARCSQCEKLGISCTRNKRHKAQLRRQAMINHLEGNLERMESRLQGLGFTVGDNDLPSSSPPSEILDDIPTFPWPTQIAEATNDTDLEHIYTSPQPEATIPAAEESPIPSIPQLFKHLDYPPAISSCFNVPRYLGGILNPGSFSLISPEGLEWIAQKTGDEPLDHLTQLVSTEEHDGFVADYPLHCVSSRRVFCPLPPQEDIVHLLHHYMEYFNAMFPVFRQSDILFLFPGEHVDIRSQSPGQWACINAVLAVSYMLPQNGASPQIGHQKSWLFLKNALEAVGELYLGPPDIQGLQALLVMAILFLAASAARPCNFLISVAIHISDQLGLGRAEDVSTFSVEETQHRQTIFWFAYCLDREISFRFGEPPVQNDDAISAALPTEAPTCDIYSMPTSDQPGSFSAFRSVCELARIRGEVYQHLYSASAANRPFHQILASVGQLDEKLQTWKNSIPSEYQPDSQAVTPFRQSPVSLSLLHIHYTYYNCMIAIHSLIAARGINSAQDLTDNPAFSIQPGSFANPRVLLSASLTSKAARASINLMKYLPQDDITLGITMYYPTVALKTLASSIVRNPRDTSQIYNMRILDQAEAFLSSTTLSATSEGMRRLGKHCAEYRSVAERAMKES
ncbi:hypothetical protein BO94DRAFT_536936 [Aspergillus sclerotioniger CBS 115572]|uniref:Zn(2)-C6 fungal-type domain-containing protein n=1 Tax=Aspergillus sclerotioniger CBS 115572 TaxID=1450535 RepID=A0A317W760_9EURO|nr:hypothetical protein BO94DRAFT_536936 [Aspergillus sclerotioniger CBS 115572]PWY81725.1 hypothetical protein BO94DRAFT_536936 [Aspergillus sclerotioniger CBS 115572]